MNLTKLCCTLSLISLPSCGIAVIDRNQEQQDRRDYVPASPFLVQEDTSPTLIGFWPLNNSAEDISGNEHNGENDMAAGAFNHLDKPLSSYYFDGNARVYVPDDNDLDPERSVSICAWINHDCWCDCPIVTKTGSYEIYISGTTETVVNFAIETNDGVQRVTSNIVDLEETWHHICGIYDSESLKIYIDGSVAKQKNVHGKIKRSVFVPLLFGQFHDYPDGYKGLIDNVILFNGAISEDQVLEIMNDEVN